MASIQGVKVTGVIVPSDTLDTYAVIDPIYGIDGLRNLTGGTSDLSLITTDRRRAGMLVGINNGASYYKLKPAPWGNTLSDWTEFTVGGSFTGGTVNGATNFTNGLTANTISATTYFNLPLSATTNTFVTGSSLNAATYIFTLTRNDGITITSNLGLLATDIKVTGGTYNINTGVVTFTNNTGGTFNVTGFSSGMTDTFTTGGTVSSGTATFTKSNGGTYSVSGFSIDNLQKTISSSYTVTSTDNNYSIMINNEVNPITITIPSGLLSKINVGFIQQGSADVTFAAGAGVTINSPASMLKIKGQNYWAYLEQVTNSNVYQLVGNLKL